MENIMPINYDNETPTVSGRDLHAALGVESNYTTWFQRMCGYGFSDGKDFLPILEESTGGRPGTDHSVTLPMAKELCMLQRTERGKRFREYFVACEEAWNSPDLVMARALKMAGRKIDGLESANKALVEDVERMRPKEIFADAVSASDDTILIGELAKILKGRRVDTGQNRLFEWMRGNGYLIERKGTDYNMPTQKSMNLGLFTIKETAITHSDGSVRIGKTPKVTGKGQLYFVNKMLKERAACLT